MGRARVFGICAWALMGCSAPAALPDASTPNDAAPALDAHATDAAPAIDAPRVIDAAVPSDGRDRLLATYLAYLQTTPSVAQSNGLRGADLTDVCDLWSSLDPSSQATYLTLTARFSGSHLADGSSMLDHVVRLYRVTGGDGATATDHGSCGGGEFNRFIVSMDPMLHDTLVLANDHHGAADASGVRDIADAASSSFWRDSHDVGGPHTPFDLSDETEGGTPRGQVQFFRDPASSVAMAPLGRTDLATLVDPYALELDQDYDCFHNSNPLCDYTLYAGGGCGIGASRSGVDLYGDHYGAVDLAWMPTGCP